MKTALVTGANRGFGLGMANYLADSGYRVISCMRDVNGFSSSRKNVYPLSLDISNQASVRYLNHALDEMGSSIDLLINNAGTNSHSATNGKRELVCELDKLDRGKMLEMYDVNALGPLMLIKEIRHHLSDNAIIMNISSDRASFHDEFANSTANYGYRAAKIALNMLTFVLPRDLPMIRVTAVHPGDIKTDMNPTGISDPYEAASIVIENVVNNWKPEFQGAFVRYSGDLYPL